MNNLEYFSKLPVTEQKEIITDFMKGSAMNGGYVLISNSDYQLLLKTQETLQSDLKLMTEKFENLQRVRKESTVHQCCNVIDSLNATLSLPPISYLVDFGKKIENVSLFDLGELNEIKAEIMSRVRQLGSLKAIND